MEIFNIIGQPLGWLLSVLYKFVNNYFGALFLFTVIIKIITFPVSLISQKNQADNAKLGPKMDILQKKYGKDPQKLREKQMQLKEKSGIKQNAGCLPSVLSLLIVFAVVAVIYYPLTQIMRMPKEVVNVAATAAGVDEKNKTYLELELLNATKSENNTRDDVRKAIDALSDEQRNGVSADEYLAQMDKIENDFRLGGESLLDKPQGPSGFRFSILILIPVLSYLTQLATAYISKKYMPTADQAGQGCMNVMMLGIMPLISLFFTFSVPCGVGIYWIMSNVLSLVQTVVLNKIYDLKKIRAQADEDFIAEREERRERKKKLAEKRRLENQKAIEESKKNKNKKKTNSQNSESEVVDDVTEEIQPENVSADDAGETQD